MAQVDEVDALTHHHVEDEALLCKLEESGQLETGLTEEDPRNKSVCVIAILITRDGGVDVAE